MWHGVDFDPHILTHGESLESGLILKPAFDGFRDGESFPAQIIEDTLVAHRNQFVDRRWTLIRRDFVVQMQRVVDLGTELDHLLWV